DFGIASF
ncbi:hypothetical protein AALP_AAs70231U000100, partial [Arabis alpina]